MWMNEMEIDEAAARFASHPVLGKATRFLSEFRDEVNNHSDGWAYWKLPAHAADKLMTFIYSHKMAGMGAYPRMPEPKEQDFLKTLSPIKSFYTRRGNKAGMTLPEVL